MMKNRVWFFLFLGILLSFCTPILAQTITGQSMEARRLVSLGKYEAARAVLPHLYTSIPANKPTEQLLWLIANRVTLSDKTVMFDLQRIQNQSGSDLFTEAYKQQLCGDIAYAKSDFLSAERYFSKSIQLFKSKAGGQSQPWLYKLLGNVNNQLELSIRATGYYTESLMLFRKHSQSNDIQIGHLLNNLGITLMNNGEFEQSKKHFKEALVFYEKNSTDPTDAGDVTMNLAVLYDREHDLKEAIRYGQKALQIWRKDMAMYGDRYVRTLMNMGVHSENGKDFKKACDYNFQALKEFSNLKNNSLNDKAVLNHNLSTALLGMGQTTEAYKYAVLARDALEYSKSPEGNYVFISQTKEIISILTLMARIEQKMAKNVGDLKKSSYYYTETMAILEYLQLYLDVDDQLTSDETSRFFLGEAIELNIKLYNTTKDISYANNVIKWVTLATGFNINKKNREWALLDQNQLTAPMIKRTDSLRHSIQKFTNAYQLLLQDTSIANKPALAASKKQLHLVELNYRDHLRDVQDQFPLYYNARYRPMEITVAQLRMRLALDQTLIQYFKHDNKIFRILLDKKQIRFDVLPVNTSFDTDVQDFRTSITNYFYTQQRNDSLLNETIDRYNVLGFKLFHYLMGDIEDELQRRLVVIPDGNIAQIPFNALLIAPAPTKAMGESWLLKRCALSYAYSAAQLVYVTRTSMSSQNMLVVNPDYPKTDLHYLPNLGKEVFGLQKRWKANVATGQNACKSSMFSLLKNYDWIHFAGHASLNSDKIETSFLEVGRCDENDNRLFIKDLYLLNCKADLVALSACETDLGVFKAGEGVISLAHGFAFMGARSLISTAWKLNDQSGSTLMGDFYEIYDHNNSKDLALQKATCDWVLAHPEQKDHPFYWASLRLYGLSDGCNSERSYRFALPISSVALFAMLALGWGSKFFY